MEADKTGRTFLKRYAWLSVAAAVFTILFKYAAYYFTDSVGMLSDAMESIVNLVGAVMALSMLTLASRPADDEHTYGYSKAEYFSSGVEGTLIFIAALSIGYLAIARLINPKPLEQIGLGLLVSAAASVVNLVTAIILLHNGKKHNSITLEANAKHLFTDVWTSAGVIVGVAAVGLTGWYPLDPILAILVALNIIWTAYHIVRKSFAGLLDRALVKEDKDSLKKILGYYGDKGIEFHALRTRQAGARRFISFHVIVPGEWTVDKGHQLLEQIEADIRRVIENATIMTHLESLNDPASWDDVELDRRGNT